MGCDIYTWFEIKVKDKNRPEVWETLGNIFDNKGRYYIDELPTFIDGEGYEVNKRLTEHPYRERSYKLFSLLAGVRNGTGKDYIKPIFPPRGVPKDASLYYLARVKEFKGSGHSHSYITFKEMFMLDWDLDSEPIFDFVNTIQMYMTGLMEYSNLSDIRLVFFFYN